MNLLILHPEEFVDSVEVKLCGERARRAHELHQLVEGVTIRAGVLGGQIGQAQVLSYGPGEMRLTFSGNVDPPPRLPVDLIVGLSRPQTIKKVVQLAAQSGVRSLSFVRCHKSQKSYLQAQILEPDALMHEVLIGLEQGGDTRAPEIVVFRTFGDFLTEGIPSLMSTDSGTLHAFIADTHADQPLPISSLRLERPDQRVICALGSEAGWTEREVQLFMERGFQAVNLGARTLRVEFATAFLLGQVALLTRDSNRS